MSFFSEWRTLTQNIRMARHNMHDAKAEITTYNDANACICHYTDTTMPMLGRPLGENITATRWCEYFSPEKSCRKKFTCDYGLKLRNIEYFRSKSEYNRARLARRMFVSNWFSRIFERGK